MPKFKFPNLGDLLGTSDASVDYREPPALAIVGLGNPGPKYAETRHNVGFWFIDLLAKKHSVKLERKHKTSVIGECTIEGQRVILVKPRTFVNLSGQSVEYLMARYSIALDKVLIVYDDINLPAGKLRLRPEGSAGGHNGIRSIIGSTKSQDFPRMRVGVGKPPEGSDQIGYVIGKMSPQERDATSEALQRVTEAVSSLLTESINITMNKFN
jgi:PTH1 family peptidyl-tRNA hydrolase